MFTSSSLMLIHSIASLHVGSGSSVSTVDLPIQREKFTNFPVLAGSGLKGSVREYFENEISTDQVNVIFGPDKDGSDYSGSVSFSDGKILLFPVKSLKGVFAWITCPLVLERFNRDMLLANPDFNILTVPAIKSEEALVTTKSQAVLGDKVVLEDYELQKNDLSGTSIDKIASFFAGSLFNGKEYWNTKMSESLLIVPDNVFKEFVEYSTEVQTRIKIGEKGVVEGGALFYEENIPAETVFYSVVLVSNPHKSSDLKTSDEILNVIKKLNEKYIQMGGDVTIGKGVVSIKFLNGGK